MEQAPESRLTLTPEDMGNFKEDLAAVGAAMPCSRCGAPASGFGMLPPKTLITLFALDEAIRGVQEKSMEVVTFVCANCGAVYHHSTGFLRQSAAASRNNANG
jgi:hypothetical protein